MAEGTRELLERLRIEPEFRDKIPPLLSEEFALLREDILKAGMVYSPIRTWNGIVIDGHHRLKVIRENPDIVWRTQEMEFADKWEAFDWMYRNQLGRRNLTQEQRKYMIGKMYEARKHTHGNHAERGADGRYLSAHDAHLGLMPETTSESVGRDAGVNQATVRRSEKFAHGVDIIREQSPEAADKVLRGEAKVSHMEVQALADADEGEVQEAVDVILSGMKRRVEVPARPIEPLRTYQPEPQSEYNIDDFIEEVKVNGEDYVDSLRRHIQTRFGQFDTQENRMKLIMAIGEIINDFRALRGEYK